MLRTLLATIALLSLPGTAWGAVVSLRQEGNVVRVLVDSEGESVNAFEGTVRIAGARAGAVTFDDTSVPYWIVRPAPEDLRFAGMVPGGYTGKEARLFSIELDGEPGSRATVSLADVSVLRNDGLGSAATVRAEPLQATLSSSASLQPRDSELPEFVEVVVTRDPAIFDGDWFVAFSARDAGSGVARVQVAEARPGMVGNDLAWRDAVSPYRLSDQARGSVVWLRAVDEAGNEAVTSVPLERSASAAGTVVLALAVALVLIAIAWAIIRMIRRSR